MKYKTKEEVSGMMFGKGIFEELLKIAEGHKDIDFWDEELLESYKRIYGLIEQIRKQDREAIIKMIEEMKFPEHTMIGETYNGTFNNIINKIKSLQTNKE